ncbi:V-type ATP synthase subunit C [Methanococcoides methylutens]|uniref:A-type ATP synthase subunit C n=1 Tax=Methanococcoides methylutens MM1 TaxID=1434104 RepID=A0A0E3SRU7_METMT|nr:V-type ATP synthase subunit C [Methanococcoides methylutens]AKB85746.1 V-type ATP synthase subunit C [Methanococcoides methylutens MM1]
MRLLQKFRGKSSPKQGGSGGSNYAYVTARVRAMKSNLLPKETYPRLMNMGIDEITRFIEESQYKQDVDELARVYDGVDLFEHALNRNLAVTFTKLISISEGELNFLISEYLKKYDIWSIKTILRGKYCGASVEEINDSIVSAGQLSYSFLSSLAEKESYESVIDALSGTDYYPTLKGYDGTNLSAIENQLDKMYYDGLFYALGNPKSKDSKLFAKLIRTEIDSKNLSTLFRLKNAGVEEDEIAELILDGGLHISKKEIERLLPLPFSDFVQSLEKYPCWEDISDIAKPEMESLVELETQLTKYNIKSATSFSHMYPLSIVPIMDYILNKKNEVNNLRIIMRGKAADLDEEIIRNQLVI